MAKDLSVLVLGATGMVGGLLLRLCLDDARIGRVSVIGRRPCGVTHARLQETIHPDFDHCEPLSAALAGQDVVFYCIGVYTGAVSADELRRVTAEQPAHLARVLHAVSPGAYLAFLSGMGADRNQRSRIAFARHKGVAENALLALGFTRLGIFRPGYIFPVTARREPTLAYRVFRWLYPVLNPLWPNMGLTSDELARAMLGWALDESDRAPSSTFENHEIRRLAARHESPHSA
ncbi:MAG: hypothetical protein KDC10_01680 [Calditrichaeota bacterium]|nr:hypothetical protein [Calditrichota bacterium]